MENNAEEGGFGVKERERVLKLLSGEKPDQVPWFGDLAYWLPYAHENRVIDPRYQGDGIYALHQDLGVGFYLQGYEPFSGEAAVSRPPDLSMRRSFSRAASPLPSPDVTEGLRSAGRGAVMIRPPQTG